MVTMEFCRRCEQKSDSEKNIFCPFCSGKFKIDKYKSMQEDYENFSKLRENIDNNENLKLEKSVIKKALSELISGVTIQMFLYANYIAPKNRYSLLSEIFQPKNPNDIEGYQRRLFVMSLNFRSFAQASFYTLLMFTVESFLRSIYEQIPNNKETKIDFNELQKKVLKHVKISNYEQSYDIFKTMALIRNCLHNDGYYQGKEQEHTKIEKYDFYFKINQLVPYRTWKHLHFFTEKIINVLEEITISVKNNHIPISDRVIKYDFDLDEVIKRSKES
ncbi:hypothetical protein YTPLAS73_11220 [Nitrosarchaeum sp.]|nr:hypothetical protein YTPLAS73_11220 [Nitrosarchaeum sp.]